MGHAAPHNTIEHFLELLFEPGDVLEVRAPGCRDRPGTKFTYTSSGYFSFEMIDKAVVAITELDRAGVAPGIYVTLNPVDSALLARSANRIKTSARETTQDANIVRRRWLLVDVDPNRPSGVSATDAELDRARCVAERIATELAGEGWPESAVVMTGNGYHLLYRVDLPADDNGLVRRALNALAQRFGDAAVSIDRSVFNAARIVKVAGTMSRKGDDLRNAPGIDDRPHRRAQLISVPDKLETVPIERLEALTGAKAATDDAVAVIGAEKFDHTPSGVRAWLEARGVVVKTEHRNGGRTLLILERCPINPDIVSTGRSDIAVLVGDDGKLAYCNKHNRGQNYTWHDLRRALDPEYVPPPTEAGDVDLSGFTIERGAEPGDANPDAAHPPNPGPLPDELLRVPGFVGEVMDFCLAAAPYPNLALAFGGALALQAFLAGRKVRDPGDNRTNIYLLGLAHSAAGKDHPRKVNTRIVHEVGLSDCLGDRFASGEGVQDALFVNPCMLFQTDEIDGMLQSINKAKDARHENVMSTLLTMYSAANTVFPMRRKAGKPSPGVIDQPNLVIFGTAIPNHYYEALSERMLTNGFFARMLILESGPRCKGQEPSMLELPSRVLETAHWWANCQPGRGNLGDWHPVPSVVDQTGEALAQFVATREEAEAKYAAAEAGNDAVGTTVWGRVSEQARKLALIYAVSENHVEPRIGVEAARWATRFVTHQTRRMLFRAAGHVAENPFHAECLKLMRKLREAPEQTLSHSKLLQLMKMDAKSFRDLIETLILRGDVEPVRDQRSGPGPKSTSYHLRANGVSEE